MKISLYGIKTIPVDLRNIKENNLKQISSERNHYLERNNKNFVRAQHINKNNSE
jgi:hypothetical protein